jgi:hypothetical protein
MRPLSLQGLAAQAYLCRNANSSVDNKRKVFLIVIT